jgi:hypothetical protein
MDEEPTRDDEVPQEAGETAPPPAGDGAPAAEEDAGVMTPDAEALADAEVAEHEREEPMAGVGEHRSPGPP